MEEEKNDREERLKILNNVREMEEEKEFNLKEKREIVKNIILSQFPECERAIDLFFMNVRTQDKEFIRRLKETEIELRDLGLTYEQGVAVWKRMNNFIDKLSGFEE